MSVSELRDCGPYRAKRKHTSLNVLVGLFLLVNTSVLLWSIQSIRVSFRPRLEVQVKQVEAVIPPVRSFGRPLAILVLDVSGSMITSDPQGQQAQAVKNFLRLYQTMVQDALKPGDQARAAVVLFATAAQVLEWPNQPGGSSPFLVLPNQPGTLEQMLDQTLNPFIATKGTSDPRQGWHTDYYAATKAVEWILDQAKETGPPCVLFMTDGADNPFLPLVPLSREEQKRQCNDLARNLTHVVQTYYPDSADARSRAHKAAGLLLAVGNGPSCLLKAGERLWDPPADGARELGKLLRSCLTRALNKLQLSPDAKEKRFQALQVSLQNLAQREFVLADSPHRLPMIWEFICLNAKTNEFALLSQLAPLLHRAEQLWHLQGTLHCRSADQLQGAFMGILGQWLNLEARPLSPSDDTFVIEPKTGGMGLAIHAESTAGSVHLLAPNGQRFSLSKGPAAGAKIDWFFGQNSPLPGLWKIEPSKALRGGTLWARPRHLWAFSGLPLKLSPLNAGSSVVSLALYDRVTGQLVAPQTVFQAVTLPSAVQARIMLPGETLALSLAPMRDGRGMIQKYTNSLPRFMRVGPGPMQMEALIGGLVFAGAALPIPPLKAEATVLLNRSVDLEFQTPQGQAISSLDLHGLVPGMTSQTPP